MGRHSGQVSVLALSEILSRLNLILVELTAVAVLSILLIFEELLLLPAIGDLLVSEVETE